MRTVNKVRRFKVGEHLNTIFSARQFGLALAVDIEVALRDFPLPHGGPEEWCTFSYYDEDLVEEWKKKWFSDFIEKGDKE